MKKVGPVCLPLLNNSQVGTAGSSGEGLGSEILIVCNDKLQNLPQAPQKKVSTSGEDHEKSKKPLSSYSTTGLLNLPIDLLRNIAMYCSDADLCRLRQTSRGLNAAVQSEFEW
jgi:hypothetical protein